MTAVVAQRESQGPSQPQGQKKRGRPAKGTFTVTEDSDLLDQVARRPVQVHCPCSIFPTCAYQIDTAGDPDFTAVLTAYQSHVVEKLACKIEA